MQDRISPVVLGRCAGARVLGWWLAVALLSGCAPALVFDWTPQQVDVDVPARTAPAIVLYRSGPPRIASLLDQAARMGAVGELTVTVPGMADAAAFMRLETALAQQAAARGGDVVVVTELAVETRAHEGDVAQAEPTTTVRARVFRGKQGGEAMRNFMHAVLFVALEEAYLPQLGRVLAHEPDLDAIWHGGETALTASIRWKRPDDDIVLDDDPVERERHKARVACVERLLAAGADPNQANLAGTLPLALALAQNDEELVRTLRSFGAVESRKE